MTKPLVFELIKCNFTLLNVSLKKLEKMKKLYYLILAFACSATLVFANPNSRIEKRWDAKTESWNVTHKTEYTYSAQRPNQVDQEISYMFNTYKNEWAHVGKTDYTYDAKGKVLTVITNNFYAPSGLWTPRLKTEYQYKGDQEIKFVYTYNNFAEKVNDWNPDTKSITSYTKGQKVSEEGYSWNASTEKWTLDTKITFKYDSKGLLVHETIMKLTKDNSFALDTNVDYTYDERNYLIKKVITDTHVGCNHGGTFVYEYE